jgi:hypothetical protein
MHQLGAPTVGAILNGAPEPRSAYYVRVTRRRRRANRLGQRPKEGPAPMPGALAPVPDAPAGERASPGPSSSNGGSEVSRRAQP